MVSVVSALPASALQERADRQSAGGPSRRTRAAAGARAPLRQRSGGSGGRAARLDARELQVREHGQARERGHVASRHADAPAEVQPLQAHQACRSGLGLGMQGSGRTVASEVVTNAAWPPQAATAGCSQVKSRPVSQ